MSCSEIPLNGYKARLLHDNNSDYKYMCPLCKLLLRNAVVINTECCGHRFCEQCFNHLKGRNQTECPECVREGQNVCKNFAAEGIPDQGMRRDMKQLIIECTVQGCVWMGRVKDYQEHEACCPDSGVRGTPINDFLKMPITVTEDDVKLYKEKDRRETIERLIKDKHQELRDPEGCNGRIAWQLEDVESKMKDAKEEGKVFESDVFCTGDKGHGYRLKGRVYLNGDGEGLGTHLSVYVMIVRGVEDCILSWPFKHTIEIHLCDLRHFCPAHIDSIIPDANSAAFNFPKGNANKPVGIQRFISLKELPMFLSLPKDGFKSALGIKIFVKM